jgi:AbrB family looped-hinge helix DNA binding protein
MKATVTIDKAGRIVLPKAARDRLRLAAGDTLALELDSDRVLLRPVRSKSAMRKERGVWVFHSGGKVTAAETDEALRNLREERARIIRDPDA